MRGRRGEGSANGIKKRRKKEGEMLIGREEENAVQEE